MTKAKLTGVRDRTVTFAPAAAGNNPGFYYGRLDTEAHPVPARPRDLSETRGGLVREVNRAAAGERSGSGASILVELFGCRSEALC